MKKGFTLIEMLVVVAIIVTLMAMVFKLGSIGGDSEKRSTTIVRLQRLENCLSGYYAAFGSYPPVAVHGSRDFTLSVDEYGIQSYDQSGIPADDDRLWHQINAACRAQPVGCEFPGSSAQNEIVQNISEAVKDLVDSKDEEYPQLWSSQVVRERLSKGFHNASDMVGSFSSKKTEDEWRELQLFKFGLMSYLLPRYLVMMEAASAFYDYKQWSANNTIPSDPFTGSAFTSWDAMKTINERKEGDKRELAKLANIPSQAVCARWMPNLEGMCKFQLSRGSCTLFGVNICGDGSGPSVPNAHTLMIYHISGNGYILDGVTVQDGWDNDLYYYSPAPYQTYILWSAGPNGKTFPAWVSKEKLDSNLKKKVNNWTADDIAHLSN